MDCKKFEELITDYLDDNLNNGLKEDFEKHLFECKRCRELFSQISENIEILSEFEVFEDEGLYDEIVGRFNREGYRFELKKENRRVELFKKIVSTAAIFIIGFLVFKNSFTFSGNFITPSSVAVDYIQKIYSAKVFSEKAFYRLIELKDRAQGFFDETKDNLDIKYKMVKRYTLSTIYNENLRR